jgi:Tfp pilus assembly protein PilF
MKPRKNCLSVVIALSLCLCGAVCLLAGDVFQPDVPASLVNKVEAAKDKQTSGRNLSEAETELLEVLRERPDYYRARLNLGLLYQNQGKTEEALQNLQLAFELRDRLKIKDDSILNSLGWSYMNAGRLDEAEKYLIQAMQALESGGDADDTQRVLNNLAYLYLQKDDFVKARQFVKMSRDKYQSKGALKVLELIQENEQRRAIKIRSDIEQDPAEHKRLVEDNTKVRLFFFVLNDRQKKGVWDASARFLSQGFYVTNVIGYRGAKRPEKTEVRYFRDDDKLEAERIDAFLDELKIPQHRPSRVNDPDSVGTGRKFQIWLVEGDFQ